MNRPASLPAQSSTLATEQRMILEDLSLSYGEGLTLARDLADSLCLPPRGMGQKLRALERRGLAVRRIAVKRASMHSDHLYGWEITPAGLGALFNHRNGGRSS